MADYSDQEPGDGALHPQREGGGGGVPELHRLGRGVELHPRGPGGDAAHGRTSARPRPGPGNSPPPTPPFHSSS